jgi:CRP-like cAMP-binding protein
MTLFGFELNELLNELIAFAWSRADLANFLGLIGGLCYVASLYLRTMVPLRIVAIVSNFFFLAYGLLAKQLPTIVLYLVLLPINIVRLVQMQQLIKRARAASQGDLSMEWIKPFMRKSSHKKGAVLFRKGDIAHEMFYTVSGRYLVTELGVELPPGKLMGELGFLAPDNRRTATVECLEDGEVLRLDYDTLRELYFQNPEFGFYFLRLTSERLLQNIARLERELEQHRGKLSADAASGTI